MIEFRKSQARPGNANNNEEDLGEMMLGSDEASLVGSVKGSFGGCNVSHSCGRRMISSRIA